MLVNEKSELKIKFLVCSYYNQHDYYQDEVFTPIQCGKSGSDFSLKILGDDTGDNISNKNRFYSELTAHYWAWKNLKNVDIIGFCHYRRYFDFHPKFFRIHGTRYVSKKKLCKEQIKIHEPSVEKLLNKYDVILTQQISGPHNVRDFHRLLHQEEDFYILRNAVLKIVPEYIKTFDDCFIRGNKYSPYNMLVCKKELFDKYAEWLFSIFFEMEKSVKISEYPYQQRLYGFLGEFMINIYFKHHKSRIKYLPVIFTIDNKYNRSFIETIILKIRDKLVFQLLYGSFQQLSKKVFN